MHVRVRGTWGTKLTQAESSFLTPSQDVYKQMLDEGCTPNLVTYNILIDVFVKKGQWEEAVKSLDTLEQQVGMPLAWEQPMPVQSAAKACQQHVSATRELRWEGGVWEAEE